MQIVFSCELDYLFIYDGSMSGMGHEIHFCVHIPLESCVPVEMIWFEIGEYRII
jgi:hypothetical protein